MFLRLLVQTILWFGVMGLLLFAGAGTVNWPAAWVFLLGMTVVSLIAGGAIARRDPGLLNERLSTPIQKDQPRFDKVVLLLFLLFTFLWLALMGVDAVRLRWSIVPLWVQVVGALLLLLAVWMNYRVFRENSFAAPVVKIQKDRGQTVIDTGPYRLVRHPMYSSGLLFFAGIALLLGSLWGLAALLLFVLLLALRIRIEEQTLRRELAGYEAYAARVRYRLIPGIW